jgi:hypothetical protein
VKRAEAFFARLFSSSWRNHQGEVAEGHLYRFPQMRQFPQASPSEHSFFLLLFLSCENPNFGRESFRQDRPQTTIDNPIDLKHGQTCAAGLLSGRTATTV